MRKAIYVLLKETEQGNWNPSYNCVLNASLFPAELQEIHDSFFQSKKGYKIQKCTMLWKDGHLPTELKKSRASNLCIYYGPFEKIKGKYVHIIPETRYAIELYESKKEAKDKYKGQYSIRILPVCITW